MSDKGEKTCPLCAEEMDITDQQLKPCKCGYEICVWCWHHIMDMAEKDDTEGRCPSCRSPYDKEKIVGTAANCERMVAEVSTERKKSQKAKTKPSEGRKQLSSVRVIQRNLVYIVGLPLTLADEDLLQQREYFGQYGKVLKVSMSRTASGVIQQFPNNTCSVYITYAKEEEAVRCIQSVHGFVLDGRSLKACFGTTKYCHAWLRNVPCTNSDCLYLHEVGSQEDSFTKDEIISAYTRSRVQQNMGATSNLLRCAGSVLPPPVDDYNNSASAAKPIIRSASNSTTTTVRSSPPNGSSGRSIGLPAAASWGMRALNPPPAVGQACSNGPSKRTLEAASGSTIPFSTAVTGITQASPLLSDATKGSGWIDESPNINGKGKSDAEKPVKQLVRMDGRSPILDKSASDNALSAGLLSNRSSSITFKYNDWGNSASQSTLNSIHHAHGGSSTKEGNAANNGQVQNLKLDLSSVRVDANARNEVSGISRTSSLSDHSSVKSPSSQVLQQPCVEQYRDLLSAPVTEKNSMPVNSICTSGEHMCWTLDQSKTIANAASDAEEDVISFDNQRLKDPEIVSRPSYIQNSANPLHAPSHSRSRSLQHSGASLPLNMNADSLYIDSRVGNPSPHHSSTNFVVPNGYSRRPISSGGLDKNVDRSHLFSNDRDVKHIARPQADNDSYVSSDVGESSIISNILSLDLDSWDDSLTSSHNFAKLLAESDKQLSTRKLSSSRKVQNSNQSRFSFARHEGPANQAFDVDSSYSNFSQLPQNRSFSQDCVDSRNPYMDQLGTVNGFSSNFEEPGSFSSSLSAVSSNKTSMPRGQIPVPPGFSAPSRVPPPGFSSHERVEQNLEFLSGNHHLLDSSLPRNSYQAPSSGNISNSGDIEFIDPAILAVGKGRFQGGLNNPVLDMRANFPQQLSAFDNETRLQLLMQRSLSPHQNVRYTDVGDSFSSLSDSYVISSRLVNPPQVNNLAPFAQLSLQQSRNGLVANGQWDGWNEVQGGNNIGVSELSRNERLGYNKLYGAAGYEDSKFRMAASGDLYNRTFEM